MLIYSLQHGTSHSKQAVVNRFQSSRALSAATALSWTTTMTRTERESSMLFFQEFLFFFLHNKKSTAHDTCLKVCHQEDVKHPHT